MATEVVCPICSFCTKHETILNRHCIDVHAVEPEVLYLKRSLPLSNVCGCGCNSTMSWHGWRRGYSKYLRGHNASVSTAFTQPDVIERSVKKRKEGLEIGRFKVWNAGLTKETSESLRAASVKKSETSRRRYKNGELTPWQFCGDRSASFEKMSVTKRQKFQSGETVSWNQGLTRETDDRVKLTGDKISKKMKGRSSRRIPLEELKSRLSTHSDRLVLTDDFESYTSKYQKLKFKCVAQGHVLEKTLWMYEHNPVCFVCHPKESTAQLAIADFVLTVTPNIVLSDRTVISPRELDIFVPSKSFAIEYNSLYYHSEKCLPERNYHDIKTERSRLADVKLLHIFEDEWRDCRTIIESMIRYRLGKSSVKYHARKLTIQFLTQADMRMFFDATHIDGHVQAETGFGLVDCDGKIVTAMSVRIPVQRKSYSKTLEIARYSTRLDTCVVGGTSRLLAAVRQYAVETCRERIMTYVDTRHGTGSCYEFAGMKRSDDTGCRFWWTDGHNRYDRFKFRADKNRKMSEESVATEAGVWKIWGCRNRIYTLDV